MRRPRDGRRRPVCSGSVAGRIGGPQLWSREDRGRRRAVVVAATAVSARRAVTQRAGARGGTPVRVARGGHGRRRGGGGGGEDACRSRRDGLGAMPVAAALGRAVRGTASRVIAGQTAPVRFRFARAIAIGSRFARSFEGCMRVLDRSSADRLSCRRDDDNSESDRPRGCAVHLARRALIGGRRDSDRRPGTEMRVLLDCERRARGDRGGGDDDTNLRNCRCAARDQARPTRASQSNPRPPGKTLRTRARSPSALRHELQARR